MGDFQNENQGMGMAVGEMQDHESDCYNIFEDTGYYHASPHISSIEDLYEFSLLDEGTVEEKNEYDNHVDEFSLVGDGGTVQENTEDPMGYFYVSHENDSYYIFEELFWENYMEKLLSTRLEPEPTSVVHPLDKLNEQIWLCHNAYSHISSHISSIEPLDLYEIPVDFQNENNNQGMGMAVEEIQDHESDCYNIFEDPGYYHASPHISSIEDLYEIPVDEFSLLDRGTVEEKNEYDNQVDEFSLVGDRGTVQENAEDPMGYFYVFSTPESGRKCEVPLISTPLSPSESYVDNNKEPIAKRPRTVCCYTIEDVVKNLPRSSSVGNQKILQNNCNISVVANGFLSNLKSPKLSVSSLPSSLMGRKNLQNNISPVINGFQYDFSLSSPSLSVSSLSSSLNGRKENLQNNISPVATGFQSDFTLSSHNLSVSSLSPLLNINSADQKRDEYQLYGDSINRLSVEPQTVAARHRRRKIQGKISSLEKLIPLTSKLETGTMLEEASKYVKILQAQLRALELVPSFLFSSNGLGSGAVGKGNAMNSDGNVEEQRGSDNLSNKEMLHLLVTSRAFQRILLSQGKCFGTVEQYQMAAAAEGSDNPLSNFSFHK